MLKRVLTQAFLLTYIFLTFCALLYTLGRKQVPHVQWPFVTHFYAMMAPFQNYTTDNSELMAYGQLPNSTWEKVDLTEYFPHGRGEKAIRLRMSSFSNKKEKYLEIAQHILHDKNEEGKGYVSVRIQWEKWPKSQYDFYGNYERSQITKSVMAEAFTQ